MRTPSGSRGAAGQWGDAVGVVLQEDLGAAERSGGCYGGVVERKGDRLMPVRVVLRGHGAAGSDREDAGGQEKP